FDIGRRGQHDRVVGAVDADRDGHFLRHQPGAGFQAGRRPAPGVDRRRQRPSHAVAAIGTGRAAHVGGSTTGQSAVPPASRWLRARVAAYRFCQSDTAMARLTSTAVTLYSGQLVAQSAYSVVTTLAAVSGKWKVV